MDLGGPSRRALRHAVVASLKVLAAPRLRRYVNV